MNARIAASSTHAEHVQNVLCDIIEQADSQISGSLPDLSV